MDLAEEGVISREEAARRGDAVQVRPARGTAPDARRGSSTWQSLARGAGGIEVDYLNGEIGLLGRLHGVPTPVNDAVQQAVELLGVDAVGALDLAVQSWGARLDVDVADALVQHVPVEAGTEL